MIWKLPSSRDLLPHGFCYQWNPSLLWLHAASDTLIALAYFLIPVALFYFVRKRRDVPFRWMFVCFGVFITACGATHVMDVWTLWVPSYWFSGSVKLATAIASVPTAVFLVRLMPAILSLPHPSEMKTANELLNRQAVALMETQRRFRQMADNIQEIFWVLDPQTKAVSYLSRAFEQICEWPIDWLYSKSHLLLRTDPSRRPTTCPGRTGRPAEQQLPRRGISHRLPQWNGEVAQVHRIYR